MLSSQNPAKKFIVLYNTAGKNIASCVIGRQRLPPFTINKMVIYPKGFIVEKKCMFYGTNDELEAHYLCAILNSDVVNQMIKPLQTRGLYGERDIVRRPLMLPIPKFDYTVSIHKRLAELSKICHKKVSKVRFNKKSVAGLRKQTKEAIKDVLKEIDEVFVKLLGTE